MEADYGNSPCSASHPNRLRVDNFTTNGSTNDVTFCGSGQHLICTHITKLHDGFQATGREKKLDYTVSYHLVRIKLFNQTFVAVFAGSVLEIPVQDTDRIGVD